MLQLNIIVCNIFEEWIQLATLGGQRMDYFEIATRGANSEYRADIHWGGVMAPGEAVKIGLGVDRGGTLKKAARKLSKAQDIQGLLLH
jgi:hypothetical protein